MKVIVRRTVTTVVVLAVLAIAGLIEVTPSHAAGCVVHNRICGSVWNRTNSSLTIASLVKNGSKSCRVKTRYGDSVGTMACSITTVKAGRSSPGQGRFRDADAFTFKRKFAVVDDRTWWPASYPREFGAGTYVKVPSGMKAICANPGDTMPRCGLVPWVN